MKNPTTDVFTTAVEMREAKEPNKTKVGKVTRKQVMDIVKTKAKDLNSRNDEAGFKIIAGTARSMGVTTG